MIGIHNFLPACLLSRNYKMALIFWEKFSCMSNEECTVL
jgi:hypothetical protein